METLLQDIKYGIRLLIKHPGFTAVAVLALALGIGANTAIFSVVNGIVLKSPPYKDPDRLMIVWSTRPVQEGTGWTPVSAADFTDWRERSQSFEQFAAFHSFPMTVSSPGEPELLGTVRVSANMFDLLGVQPLLGRTFSP